PAPHIGHIYNLTGPESVDLDHYAQAFSGALGRTIRYRDMPTSEWIEKLQAAALPGHGTAGGRSSTPSTSIEEMFSPPLMITSLIRSRISTYPVEGRLGQVARLDALELEAWLNFVSWRQGTSPGRIAM